MFGFPWSPETNKVETEVGEIRSTSRSNHLYDFEDISNSGEGNYRVLDIGCGGADYMEDIADNLYEEGIEDFQIIGVDLNEELLRRVEMSPPQLFADGVKKTAEKSWDQAMEGDYPRALYDATRGFYNSIKGSMENEGELPDEAQLVIADGQDLPFEDDTFDLVISQFLIGYDDIIDSEKIRSEAERVARTEGDIWFYGD